ncbi:MAG: M48 family metalloprotease [Capsulimonas sp.]|uniref:M48 family metalloprotease n=1 Tax=Capsulimonas sp. TaxID=2494211 RepID=UPI0032651CF6
MNESRRRFLRNAAFAGAGLVVAPTLLIAQPAEAGGLFAQPSPDQQKKVGDEAAKEILRKYKEVFDGRAKHFDTLGRRLVAALPESDRKTWNYRFHVLDSKEVNAFALPGGDMFMFTGLYEKLKTDDALVAVTGHEMTHVRKQHWAKAYKKSQERNTLLALGLAIFHAGQGAQTIAQLADSAISSKFSRSEEDEADAGGLQNMVDAGYNPQGMIELFEELQKVSGNGGGLGGDFMSDHPLTSARINSTKKRIAEFKRDNNFPAQTPLDYNSLK